MWHAYWSSSSSLPNIIKLSQIIWELWPAQDFGFRGDNYITKTVRVVTLTCNIPTGPLLHFYQTFSKYVLGYQSYGLHKISASGEITTQQIKWELSLLHTTCSLILLFILTKYDQIISNSMGVMACTRFWLQGRLYKEDSESCLSCTWHTYWSSFITKICLRVSKLWSAQRWIQFLLQGR